MASRDRALVLVTEVSPLEDRGSYEKYYRYLPPFRRQRTDEMRSEKDKRLSVGAGALLRMGYERFGIDISGLDPEYGINGKPSLRGCADVHFNISHSGTAAACVFSCCENGCDVERSGRDRSRIAKRFFSPCETACLEACQTQEEADDMFLRLWTLKESFLKAEGTGLSSSLSSFEIRFGKNGIQAVREGKVLPYSFMEEVPLEGYRLSVCLKLPYLSLPPEVIKIEL